MLSPTPHPLHPTGKVLQLWVMVCFKNFGSEIPITLLGMSILDIFWNCTIPVILHIAGMIMCVRAFF